MKQGKFEGQVAQFNAYLRQICKYKWINRLKSASGKNLSLQADISVYENDGNNTEDLETQIKQSQILDESFAQLGDRCKELLTLFYFKKQALARIAVLMKHTEESIKTIKYRCMMKLREIYLEKHKDDE